MTNPYFTAGTITPHTIARASTVQAEFTKVQTAFDDLHANLNEWGRATSSSALSISTGTKAFTVASGRFIEVGQVLTFTASSDAAAYMTGRVTAYDHATGAGSINVTETGGSGTFSSWIVAISVIASLPGDVVTASAPQTLTGKTMDFGDNTFSMTLAELDAALSDATPATSNDVTAAKGIITAGLVTITSTLSLTRASHARKSLFVTTSGITITFPSGSEFAAGEGVTLTNASGADITLAFPGGSDTASTTMKDGTSAHYFCNGAGAWKEIGRSCKGFIAQSVRIDPSGAVLADSVGYRGLPQNARSGAYVLGLSDAGKQVTNTTGGWTIPANASVPFPVGTTIVLFNRSGSSQALSITSDTLRQAGTTNTGARTVGNYGIATIIKVDTTEWWVSGVNVT